MGHVEKLCKKCNTTKPVSEFAKNKNRKDGLNGFCKACVNSYRIDNEAYRLRKIEAHKENKEHNNARTARWRKNNADYAKAYMQEWLKDNKDKKAESDRLWKQNNREYIRNAYRARMIADNAKRNAIKRNAMPRWANNDEIKNIYNKAQELKANGILVEVDHIVPLRSKYVCGLHVENNLQILTREENAKKGNRYWPQMS